MAMDSAINLPELDTPVYRIFRLPHFWHAIERKELVLVAPHLWDDPFENLLAWCMLQWEDEPSKPQVSFAELRKPLYAQCWSQVKESDALWRAYSRFAKDDTSGRNRYPDEEGVQVRTTPRKLIQALHRWTPADPAESCFVGRVTYLPRHALAQYVADEIGRGHLHAFPGGRGHAESILFKRDAFAHEDEVRLVYVEMRDGESKAKLMPVAFSPNDLFDEVVFDPRLPTFERLERESRAKHLGFSGTIAKSDLYQRVVFQIGVRRRRG